MQAAWNQELFWKNSISDFRRKAQVRTNTLFIFIKSVPNAKETPKGRGGKVKPYKSGHSPRSPTVSPLQSFSLPSHPHQARFYRCALILLFVSYIKYWFVPFTAAPLICGLPFIYQVSAVSFAWLCGGDWWYCSTYFNQLAIGLITLTVGKRIS